MISDADREQACQLFLSHTNMVYISTVMDDGEERTALFDDDGDAIAIGPEDLLRSMAATHGLVLLTKQ